LAFQALNGFLMILDCNGELFFATHTIETYLGFHQSDVIHQVPILPNPTASKLVFLM
jgi:hypothetical protein